MNNISVIALLELEKHTQMAYKNIHVDTHTSLVFCGFYNGLTAALKAHTFIHMLRKFNIDHTFGFGCSISLPLSCSILLYCRSACTFSISFFSIRCTHNLWIIGEKNKQNKLNKCLLHWRRLAHFRFDITIIGWIRNDGRLLNSYGLSKLKISTHQRPQLVLQRKNQHSVSFMRCAVVSLLHTDLHCISFLICRFSTFSA